jgi:hypothetical protein
MICYSLAFWVKFDRWRTLQWRYDSCSDGAEVRPGRDPHSVHCFVVTSAVALTMTIAAVAVSKAEMLADGKKKMYEGQIVELELKLQVRAGDTHTHLIETDTEGGRERDAHVVLTWIWLTMTSDDDDDRL